MQPSAPDWLGGQRAAGGQRAERGLGGRAGSGAVGNQALAGVGDVQDLGWHQVSDAARGSSGLACEAKASGDVTDHIGRALAAARARPQGQSQGQWGDTIMAYSPLIVVFTDRGIRVRYDKRPGIGTVIALTT